MITHPYFMVLAGIFAWQIEQAFSKGWNTRRMIGCIGSSMFWGSGVVVWDDEVLGLVNTYFQTVIELDWRFYITAGFIIDIVRSKITKK